MSHSAHHESGDAVSGAKFDSSTTPAPSGIIAWFVSNPVAANLLMLSILFGGIVITLGAQVETFPRIPPKTITISIAYDSGSALAGEEGVAIKIEEALQGLQGVASIASTSTKNRVLTTVERETGYDLDQLNKDVKNALDSLSGLPEAARQPVITQATRADAAISVQVTGEVAQDVLQETARRLRKQLLRNPHIKQVTTKGSRVAELQIAVNEQRLQAYGLTFNDIATQINATSFSSRGGELSSEDGDIIIQAGRQRYRGDEFGAMTLITTTDGRKIPLSTLATATESYEKTAVISRFNGQPSIALTAVLAGEENLLTVAKQVGLEVEAFEQAGNVPQGISLTRWNNRSDHIKARLGLLAKNGLSGILIVLIVLALFLNLKVAFWVAAGIPVAMAGAMLLIDPVYGITINQLSTFGFIIALGILVDDAVVVGESVHAEHRQYGASLNSTIRGAQKVAMPTVYGVLTSMLTFQSISLIEGDLGNIFGVFAQVIVAALIFSLLETKLILPAHLAQMSDRPSHRFNFLARGWGLIQSALARGMDYSAQHIYRPALYFLLPFRYALLAATVALMVFVGGLVVSGQVKFVFFPQIPGDTIVLNLVQEQDVGSGLTRRQAILIEAATQKVNQQMRAQGERSDVFAHVQTIGSSNQVTIVASLIPRAEREVDTYEIADAWWAAIPALEGVRSLKMRTSREGVPPIEVELGSENRDILQQASERVLATLQGIRGAHSLQSDLTTGQVQINLTLKPAGEAMGLSASDLATQVQRAYLGLEVQRFQRGTDEVKVRLFYPQGDRRNLSDLRRAMIRTNNGAIVPLETVAALESVYVSDDIKRLDGARAATITGDVDKAIIAPATINALLEQSVFVELRRDFPQLTIKLGGEAKEQAQTTQSMTWVFAGTLLAIYALLAIPLKSYVQPLVIMMAIPFGMIGAVFGHWLYALPLSVLSLFGIIALSGVVINNSLLLVNRYNELVSAGMRRRKAIINAGSQRMRAVILTSVTTFAGLLPLMSETSLNAQFLIPAALSIAYGSLFAMVITLILIPCLLAIMADLRFRSMKAQELGMRSE